MPRRATAATAGAVNMAAASRSEDEMARRVLLTTQACAAQEIIATLTIQMSQKFSLFDPITLVRNFDTRRSRRQPERRL